MKKILFITSEALDNPKRGTPIRILNFIKQISLDHKIFIAAPTIDSNMSGYKVIYSTSNTLRAALHYRNIIQKEKIDVVMTATETNLTLPVLIKFLTRVKIVVDLHGLYGEELYYERLIGNIKRKLLEQRKMLLLPFYDLIIVCSLQNKEYYSKVSKNTLVIFDGLDIKKFFRIDSLRPGIFTIGYSGNGKPYQGLDHLLEACAAIKKERLFPFKLNLVLSSGTTHIQSTLNAYNLEEETDLHFKVSQEDANKLTNQASVLVVPRPSLKMTEYAYPSKLPKDLITGIPTIATAVGPVKDLFGPNGVCIVIPPQDIVRNLKKAIIDVYHMNPEKREELGRIAESFVRTRLTWDILGKDINSHLESL